MENLNDDISTVAFFINEKASDYVNWAWARIRTALQNSGAVANEPPTPAAAPETRREKFVRDSEL